MALRTTFGELIEMVRNECKLSSNSSRGIDHLEHIKQLIQRHYAMLTDEFTWEFLRVKREDAGKDMATGQRYYDFPVALDPAGVSKVWHLWGNVWREIPFGISPMHYTIHDSDSDEQSDPVERWDFYGSGQFEVWPMPASASGEIRFEGAKIPEALVDEGDRADMDDHLLVLRVSAEILESHDRKWAQMKAAAANQRMGQLRAQWSDKSRFVMSGGDPTSQGVIRDGVRWPRHPTFIRGT